MSKNISEDIISELKRKRKEFQEQEKFIVFSIHSHQMNRRKKFKRRESYIQAIARSSRQQERSMSSLYDSLFRYMRELNSKEMFVSEPPTNNENIDVLLTDDSSTRGINSLTLQKYITYKGLTTSYLVCEDSWILLRETETSMQSMLKEVILSYQVCTSIHDYE